jgi:hypothetical protein
MNIIFESHISLRNKSIEPFIEPIKFIFRLLPFLMRIYDNAYAIIVYQGFVNLSIK